MSEKEIVDADAWLGSGDVARDAEAAGGVGLGIAVHEEGGDAFEGESGCEIDGSCGFADSALLIDDGDDFSGFGRCGVGGIHRRIQGIGMWGGKQWRWLAVGV